MTDLEKFIDEWFPKTEQWKNIGKFILESGIHLTDVINPKWLTGYTDIGVSYKPHHEDGYIRYMEESMFVLHDVVHNIFTLEVNCSEEEYVKRQIYGELFTFYLTEYVIPSTWKNTSYRQSRGCYDLVDNILKNQPNFNYNVIDWFYEVFINSKELYYTDASFDKHILEKYRKMFKEDLENSRKNYKFVPEGVKSYCMVGESSQNHIDFFEAVSKGAIKNIKREFNLELSKQWI